MSHLSSKKHEIKLESEIFVDSEFNSKVPIKRKDTSDTLIEFEKTMINWKLQPSEKQHN